MSNAAAHPPDAIDEEWLSLICDHCLLTALCVEYRDCCPLQRIHMLAFRAQVPDSELLAALVEAKQFLKEDQ